MAPPAYDVVIAGAGAVGLPAACFLAEAGLKPLVLDPAASPAQGATKAAIGGVRATHSRPSKIRLGLESLKVLSTWRARHGDDIQWHRGGYVFVAYRDQEQGSLQELLRVQQSYGLNIRWLAAEELREVVPGLRAEGLRGGTYSPEDGSASPLLASRAFYERARALGSTFRFQERVTGVVRRHDRLIGVRTNRGAYATERLVNAAGPWARPLAALAGEALPVTPDSHEAGVTEPVARFFEPMIVDIRPAAGSKNYYFYQHADGQILFCITPDPPIVGTDCRETSAFLPQIASRLVELMPRLGHVKVRRTWRGLYPMTPDGSPLVGWSREVEGLVHAAGMCGQGFMLGPGVGALVTAMIAEHLDDADEQALQELDPYREMDIVERLR